jgi:hypothetical protein
LVRLLFKGFEILVIDIADDINKHSVVAIRRMNRDGRGHPRCGQHDQRGPNQTQLQSADAN